MWKTTCFKWCIIIRINWHVFIPFNDLSLKIMKYDVDNFSMGLTKQFKWRLLQTAGNAYCHTPAICSPVYQRGPPATWLDLCILWRASCQVICLHEMTLSALFPLTTLPLVSSLFLPCAYMCIGSGACDFTIPHLRITFFLLNWKKNGKEENERENSRSYYCAAFMALLSSLFPPLLSDGTYQTVRKYCG